MDSHPLTPVRVAAWARASVVPVIGVIPTLLFRSNTRNLKIIKRHLDKHHAHTAVIEGEVVARQ